MTEFGGHEGGAQLVSVHPLAVLYVETRPGLHSHAPVSLLRADPRGQGGGGVQLTRPHSPLSVVFQVSAKPAAQWQEANCVPSAFCEKTRLALLTQGGGGVQPISADGVAL